MPFKNVLSPCDNVTCAVATKRWILRRLLHKTMHNSTNGSYNDHISQLAHNKRIQNSIYFFCEEVEQFLSSRCKRQMQINSIQLLAAGFYSFLNSTTDIFGPCSVPSLAPPQYHFRIFLPWKKYCDVVFIISTAAVISTKTGSFLPGRQMREREPSVDFSLWQKDNTHFLF